MLRGVGGGRSDPPAYPIRHALVLFGWQSASFFTALENRELLVEPRNQLPDSCFCESILPDWMLTLETLKPRLQITQL